MNILTVLSWCIYGIVILLIMSLWFILLHLIFRKPTEFISPLVFFLWLIPSALFLGAMAFYATKYLVLLGLVK